MKRSKLTKSMFILLAGIALLLGWRAIAQPPALPPRIFSEPQQRMLQKFGPNRGYELRVDAMKGEEFEGVNFYEVGEAWPFYGKGGQTLENETEMAVSGPVPEQVRITWRDSAEQVWESKDGSTYSGNIIGDEIIEVGSRIPQAVIDDLKNIPRSGLNLKFRMSKQGTLVGWDVIHHPDYIPNKRDQYGSLILGKPVYTAVGGDFREAEIFNGEVVRKGWYIDKKTGQKIETDF